MSVFVQPSLLRASAFSLSASSLEDCAIQAALDPYHSAQRPIAKYYAPPLTPHAAPAVAGGPRSLYDIPVLPSASPSQPTATAKKLSGRARSTTVHITKSGRLSQWRSGFVNPVDKNGKKLRGRPPRKAYLDAGMLDTYDHGHVQASEEAMREGRVWEPPSEVPGSKSWRRKEAARKKAAARRDQGARESSDATDASHRSVINVSAPRPHVTADVACPSPPAPSSECSLSSSHPAGADAGMSLGAPGHRQTGPRTPDWLRSWAWDVPPAAPHAAPPLQGLFGALFGGPPLGPPTAVGSAPVDPLPPPPPLAGTCNPSLLFGASGPGFGCSVDAGLAHQFAGFGLSAPGCGGYDCSGARHEAGGAPALPLDSFYGY